MRQRARPRCPRSPLLPCSWRRQQGLRLHYYRYPSKPPKRSKAAANSRKTPGSWWRRKALSSCENVNANVRTLILTCERYTDGRWSWFPRRYVVVRALRDQTFSRIVFVTSLELDTHCIIVFMNCRFIV